MRRVVICVLLLLPLCVILSPDCRAALSDDPIAALRAGVSDEVRAKMEDIGYDASAADGGSLSFGGVLSLLFDELSSAAGEPLSCCAVMIGVLILSSVLEGYTHSLRYTETRDIMAAVTALMISASLITPLIGLIRRTVGVISGTASLMLIYVPIMAGLLAFGGHPVQAGGACVSVMTAAQVIAQLSAHLIPQMLCAYLAIGVSCGVSGRVRLGGFCEMLGKFIKWFIGILMALFSTVLSLQSTIARAGDTVASRAARMTLSSAIPLIGSALSDAYKTIQGSVDLLRSGAGVFVILAVLIAFLPMIVQAFLWLAAVRLSGCAAEALGVAAPVKLFSAVASVLTVLIALALSVMTAFIVSTAVLIRAGGAG